MGIKSKFEISINLYYIIILKYNEYIHLEI